VTGRLRRGALLCALVLPAVGAALEPRYDHREQHGPTVEFLYAKDTFWRGSSTSSYALRGAVQAGWAFDPTGDGGEIFAGGTLAVAEGARNGPSRNRLALDLRYRGYLGTEELNTLFEIGITGQIQDRFAIGPALGFGIVYHFSRNFGLFASAFLSAAFGEERVVSYGGGLGALYRFDVR
jgi:hypothetical protein